MPIIVEWNGKEIVSDTEKAARDSIDATNFQAVALARRPFPVGVPILTGFASANLTIEPARKRNDGVMEGYFYGGAVYTIWLELRYGFMVRAWTEAIDDFIVRIYRNYK